MIGFWLKLKMNNKGVSIIVMIIEVLVVVLVSYMTISIAHTYANSDTTFKINTAEDMRMMVETLVGVPGDAIVEYPLDVSKYTFILTQGSVSVFVKGEAENLWVTRNFFLPEGYESNSIVENPKKLCFEKIEKRVSLKEC